MRALLQLLFVLFLSNIIWANGVCIKDASENVNLRLTSSAVEVSVESQIAIVKTTQAFLNDLNQDAIVKYGFPLPEGASAIALRWHQEGIWYEANMSAAAQDTTLPGSGSTVSQNLVDYLGVVPLYFPIEDAVKRDSTIMVELTYVQLLPYEFGNVDFTYPSDYSLIQAETVTEQTLDFQLNSLRTIESISLLSDHNLIELLNSGNSASLKTKDENDTADENYVLRYSLALDQLGLFGYSTQIPDSLVPDNGGSGFLSFIAEPDPGNTVDVIDKVFTLIIDRSGSMSGNKIVQARNAASFIVENLNEGDRFNIVDFSSNITSFSSEHLPYNSTSRNQALNYIASINAGGGTNISGAFDVAVPQFSTANDSTANIIIFFTDGEATSGITNTTSLLNHVQNLIAIEESNIMVFTFGIGANANRQLLTLLASQNSGLSVFLDDNDLFDVISEFYLQIRNPVMLNTSINFTPAIVNEVYPEQLPNLYKGQQLIISGRYNSAQPITVTLSGEAFGQSVSYDYNLDLSGEDNDNYRFLTKLWAKQKIEHLLVQYYSLDPNSVAAQLLKEEIVGISLAYGVVSPFTRFSGGDPVGIEDEETLEQPITIARDIELLGNYPNPFNPSTTIRVQVKGVQTGLMKIKIYNTLGQLVRVLFLNVTGNGLYEITWDGMTSGGLPAASGNYVYIVEFENYILAKKMTLMK